MQQTATEWLFQQLWETPIDKLTWYAILKQATAMEKQQIIDAYSIGAINGEMIERDIKPKYTNPIQYYNKTFKSE